jgi:putative Mn2+ efflux pump MntP
MTDDGKEALLEYYSQNATTHAALVVAIIFGLFSVLSIALYVQETIRWIFVLPVFVILAVLGHYEIRRFLYYGDNAKKIADIFIRQYNKTAEEPLEEETKRNYLSFFFENFHFFYSLFLLLSFLAVYGPDILRFLCACVIS